MNKTHETDLIVFRPQGSKVDIEVKFKNETVWLTQAQMAELFLTDRSSITKHLRNIFNIKELEKERNVQKLHIPNSDKPVLFYNLDVTALVVNLINKLN